MKVKEFLDIRNGERTRGQELIHKMKVEFDSHTFIKQLIKDYESDYVELLKNYTNVPIFKTLHAQIGKYLSQNKKDLFIIKLEKIESENIKGYESENQKWRKKL
jgi:hypothetical protein